MKRLWMLAVSMLVSHGDALAHAGSVPDGLAVLCYADPTAIAFALADFGSYAGSVSVRVAVGGRSQMVEGG